MLFCSLRSTVAVSFLNSCNVAAIRLTAAFQQFQVRNVLRNGHLTSFRSVVNLLGRARDCNPKPDHLQSVPGSFEGHTFRKEKVMKRILFSFFLILFSVSPSFAGPNWIFGLDGGLAVPTQNYFPLSGLTTYPSWFPHQNTYYFHDLEASEGWMIDLYGYKRITPWLYLGLLGSYDTTGASANAPVSPSAYLQYPNTGAVKTNLGMVETWALLLGTRIEPWTFGRWTPFLGLAVGNGWNQWIVPSLGAPWTETGIYAPLNHNGTFSAHLSDAIVTRLELGTDYRISDAFSLEATMGGQINDPLARIDLPRDQLGMDQNFNLILFFVNVGVQFNL